MHIMEVVSGAGFNGATKYCFDLIRSLRERGHQVTPVCVAGGWLALKLEEQQIPYIHSALERWPLTELRRISKYCRDHGVDVIHTHNSRAHFFGVLLRKLFSIPTVATAHQNHVQLHWRFNDHVIANSDATLAYHRKYNLVRKAASSRVYCPIDTDSFHRVAPEAVAALRTQWELNKHLTAIGIVGNVADYKGHMFLVQALPKILAAVPTARLIIVGMNMTQYGIDLRREAKRLNVDHAICWAGYQDNPPAIMHALDLVVCASLNESFGLTAAEALAAGRTVVATKVGGLPETVLHRQTGLLVDPGSPDQLAASVIELLQNEELRKRYAAAGKQRVCELFSTTNHIRSLEQVFERVTPQRRATADAA